MGCPLKVVSEICWFYWFINSESLNNACTTRAMNHGISTHQSRLMEACAAENTYFYLVLCWIVCESCGCVAVTLNSVVLLYRIML